MFPAHVWNQTFTYPDLIRKNKMYQNINYYCLRVSTKLRCSWPMGLVRYSTRNNSRWIKVFSCQDQSPCHYQNPKTIKWENMTRFLIQIASMVSNNQVQLTCLNGKVHMRKIKPVKMLQYQNVHRSDQSTSIKHVNKCHVYMIHRATTCWSPA